MDTNLNCDDVLERLPLHVGEDLDADVQAAVTRHLERCEPCRAHERDAARARDVLRSTFDAEVVDAPALWPGIRAKLAEEGLLQPAASSAASLVPERRPVLLRRPFASVAAAAAVVAVFGFLFLLQGGEPETTVDVVDGQPAVTPAVFDPPTTPFDLPAGPADGAVAETTEAPGGLIPLRNADERLVETLPVADDPRHSLATEKIYR